MEEAAEETYEVGFEKAKKKCFMSVDKSHLTTILELSDPKDMFSALDKKYYTATNACKVTTPTSSIFQQIGLSQNLDADDFRLRWIVFFRMRIDCVIEGKGNQDGRRE